uniref:Tropomodulin n=1 Tax=Plectus sambesii TaxID=2011161 RepID=A0A914VD47_9BILA
MAHASADDGFGQEEDDSDVPVMTDADFESALDRLKEETDETGEVGELLKMMNENRIITWEEAEQIMSDAGPKIVKCSLPEQARPTEPDNETDVESSIKKLTDNDPKLKVINLNNMKRTPIPQVQRLIMAIEGNTQLETLSLANMGLYDGNVEPLIAILENNESLKSINLETNYLSGEFFSRLFKAALVKQTVEQVKAVNQGVTFSTTAEKEIIDAIFENQGLTKVSINLRLPEGRHKIENAMLRNGEIRRVKRRQEAAAAAAAAAKKAKDEADAALVPKLPKSPPEAAPKKAAEPAKPKSKPADAKESPKSKPGVRK